MSKTRMALLDLLKLQLDSDLAKAKKQAILQKSERFWEIKELANRSFDPLQNLDLMDPELFSLLANEFETLLEIKSVDTSDYSITSESDKAEVKKWQNKVIDYVCESLLNKDRSLQPEFIDFLEWNEHSACYSMTGILDILCSYSGILLQHFILANDKKRIKHLEAYHAIVMFVTHNLREWIQENENYKLVKIDLNIKEDGLVKLALKVGDEIVTAPEVPKPIPLVIQTAPEPISEINKESTSVPKLPETLQEDEDGFQMVPSQFQMSPVHAASVGGFFSFLSKSSEKGPEMPSKINRVGFTNTNP